MSELMPDALFGVDGTELPQSSSDPSGRGGGHVPELPPLTLPAIPGFGATREEIAATHGEGRILLADQHRDPSSAQQPAAAPSAAAPKAPPAHVLSAHVLAANALAVNAVSARVPSADVPSANVTAPLLAHAAPQLGGPSAAVAPNRNRSRVPAPVPPGKLAPPTSRSLSFRPLRAAGARTPVLLSDLRRRVGRQGAGLPLQLGSGGGAGAFFFIALIIFMVLAYGIIAGIVESIIKLF